MQPTLCLLIWEVPGAAVGRVVLIWHNNVDTIRNWEFFPALCSQNWPSSYPDRFDPLSGVYRDITSLAVDDAGHT